MSNLDERIAALAPEKRALFAKLMREQSREENAFPISVMQQGIWFLEQLKPHNPAYVIPAAVRISGPLDAGAYAPPVAATRSLYFQPLEFHQSS